MLLRFLSGVALWLRDLFLNEGKPEKFHTDNGSEFINKVMAAVVDLLQTNDVHGNPYNPQAQGKVENANRHWNADLGEAMNKNKGTNWSELVSIVTSERNDRPRKSLNWLSPRQLAKPQTIGFGHNQVVHFLVFLP